METTKDKLQSILKQMEFMVQEKDKVKETQMLIPLVYKLKLLVKENHDEVEKLFIIMAPKYIADRLLHVVDSGILKKYEEDQVWYENILKEMKGGAS